MSKWIGVATVLISLIIGIYVVSSTDQKSEARKAANHSLDRRIQSKMAKLQIPFIQNKGQMNPEVGFYAQTFAGTVFVTKEGEIVYGLSRGSKGVVVKESLVEADTMGIKGENKAITKVNSFIGNDPTKWQRNIATFGVVDMGEVYPGIGLKLKAYGKNVEKLFEVKPGTGPDTIKVKLKGAKDLKVNAEGELVVTTESGDIKFTKPVAYQEIDGKRVDVPVSYNLKDLEKKLIYGFKVGEYNPQHSLTIDPLLASTFLGGNDSEGAEAFAIDTSGNIYVAGATYSTDFPGISGSLSGQNDAFVSKLNYSMTQLLFSTLVGGSESDASYDIALDADGNVFIAGNTTSSDFPVTQGVLDSSFNGHLDAFVTKLDGGSLTLLTSTFIGGTGLDDAEVIKIDPAGDIYIGGQTSSSDYPITVEGFQTARSGGDDGFVSKIDPSLTNLMASTYVGGTSNETITDLLIDSDGDVFFTGSTFSADYPTRPEAYDPQANGDNDVFVSKLDGELSTLLASTFIGGSGQDRGSNIAQDSDDNIYVTGSTESGNNFPKTNGAFDTSANGQVDVFISKLDEDLTRIVASTYLGGAQFDYPNAMALGPNGDIYVGGQTGLSEGGFPIIDGAYDTTWGNADGAEESFISKLSPDLSSLSASSYLGGAGQDYIRDMAMDLQGDIIVVGETGSEGYPVSSDAFDTSYNGFIDVFVSKVTQGLSKFVDTPSFFGAMATSPSSVVLSWKDLSRNERGFKIERRTGTCGGGSRWSQKKVVGQGVTTFRDRNRLANTRYSYRIRAFSAGGNSGYSNCREVTTGIARTPDSPSGFKAISLSANLVRLTWLDNSDDETRFVIRRKIGNGGFVNIPTNRPPDSAQYDTTAAANSTTTSFQYKIVSCNAAGCSRESSTAIVPFQPRDVDADASDFYQMNVSWTDTSENEIGFQISRRDGGCSSENPWFTIKSVGANKEIFSDTLVESEKSYGYRVRSIYKSNTRPFAYGYSRWSACAEETAL